jgi:hypothetical protein
LRIKKDVFGLEITMDDIPTVSVVEALPDLSQDGERLLDGYRMG